MTILAIDELVTGLYSAAPQRSNWSRGSLPGRWLESLLASTMALMDADLAELIGVQRLAYASAEALTYPDSEGNAHDLWGSGLTAILQSLQYSPGLLQDLSIAMELRERRRISCSAYVSSAGASSFSMHTDDWDVFALLLQGEKTFWIDEEPSHIEVGLLPGDVLYIPRHKRHRAESTTGSLHLNLDVLTFPSHLGMANRPR